MEKEPQFEQHEGIKKSPTIRLEFMRHDKPAPTEPGKSSDVMPLAPESRVHAQEVGKTKNPNPEQALAYGSPRARSQDTAMRQMLAQEDWISAEMSFEDVDQAMQERMPVGKKLAISEKLNFKGDANPEYKKVYQSHYAEGKDLVPFLFNESDDLVVKLGDTEDYSYTRLAANIAELIEKYIGILPRWQKLVEEKEDMYGKDPELQRFLGTHSTITESFLLKVIEKTQGRAEAEQFIANLPDKNGIGFSDGISVEISSQDDQPVISIRFHEQEWVIDKNTLDEIINDRAKLDEAIRANR